VDLESGLSPKSQQISDPSRPALSERKMLSHEQVTDSYAVSQDLKDERVRGECGKGCVEFQKQHFLHAGSLKPRKFFIHGGQETEISAWREDFDRMGIKRQHHGGSPRCHRGLNDRLQQRLVAAMLPVEVADGQHRMRRMFVFSEAASDSHAIRFMRMNR
jgi:hypothetical protein